MIVARYVHTNLVAHDWQRLAAFYQEVFGCEPVPPERHFSGAALEHLSAVGGAELRGMHLRLPGYGDNGPTLEIFEYQPRLPLQASAVNRPGFGHIAFAVADVESALQELEAAGGRAIGAVVSLPVGDREVRVVYAADPEGNIVELQTWRGRHEDRV